jgi:TonB-linked SusC/RagA family outer membrane protein
MKKKLRNYSPPAGVGIKKLLRAMKIALTIIILCIQQVNASIYSQTAINLNVKNEPLREVLKKIEQKSSFRFFYSDDLILLDKKINIRTKSREPLKVLDDICQNSDLTYRVFDNNLIVITSKSSIEQQFTVSGLVTDKDGQPLIGVNVFVDGTTIGTVTDLDGHYELAIPDQNAVLVFSSIGYLTEKVPIEDNKVIDLVMIEDIKNLQEVVVTALGIKRDKKALSYSSQQLSSDEISKGQNLNFVGSLSGRAAGIDLRKSNTGAGGSTKIILRGTKSFYGSSQPLFVIDGIPMANYQTSDAKGFWGGVDSGDGLSNLNPDDIESINILKGSNAAALYGSQGSNGVIIITTKKGAKGKAKIELSSSTVFQKASILPKLQTKYGQTSEGAIDSWGEKGSYTDPINDFFRTGIDMLNSVSISGGNEMASAYLSFANSSSKGIMPTNNFNKNNVTLSLKSEFFKNFSVSTNVMFTDQKINNKILNGYYFNPLTGLYLFPRGLNMDYYKENYQVMDPDRNMLTQNWFTDQDTQQNPYWILHNNANDESTKRVLGSINMEYKLTKAISIQARGNYDYTHQIYEQKIKAGTQSTLAPDNGRWIYNNTTSSQQYIDLLVNYTKDFGLFDVYGLLGTSYQKKIIGDGINIDSDKSNLIVPNEFYMNNLDLSSWNGEMKSVMTSKEVKESVFGNLSLGYNKMLYLDVSGRKEWSSTLAATSKDSYFYPSIGLSAIISEMATLPTPISFAKLRASYSYVGKEIPAFMTIPMNTVSAKNGVELNTEMSYRELKPETQKSLELGAEMRFLKNRLGFEATYYHIDNLDEFLKLAAPAGSGYTFYYVNAGQIRNTGVEAVLTIFPVKNNTFTWKSDINFSKNNNKVIKLDPSLKGKYNPEGGGEGYDMTITEGGSIGDIYVNAFLRDSTTGKIILNDDNLPVKAKEEKLIGSANPDFAIGWNNTFTYKNASLSFLIDGKFGGKFVDMTEAWYDQYGLSQRSADARDAGGVLVSGIKEDGTEVSTTVDAKSYYTRTGGRGSFVEPYVYDATNIRLRQLVISYLFDVSKIQVFFKTASLSLVGNNLFFFYREAPFDPDNTISTGINTQSVENFSLSPTRSFGFNIKLNF